MSETLVLYDDVRARAFEPFALTRPAGELRAGAELVRRRWERVTGARSASFASAPHLQAFEEWGAPPAVTVSIPAGSIVVNTRFAPALDAAVGEAQSWSSADGRVTAVRLAAPLDPARLGDGSLALESLAAGPPSTLTGWWIDEPWDLIGHLQAMLEADIAVLGPQEGEGPPAHLTVLGAHEVFVARGAYIEPFVLADSTVGPVLVRRGARISAFTRLVGPCVIGEDTIVGGGRITGCSIGEMSRVHGELSTSIVIGHANKAHDGFVGHSVLGRWSNLGAGTITSNLKNSYGDVALWTPSGTRRTGLQFLGTYFGDHVKTGIGTRLTTGCVIGAGANVFGSMMPPKFVPPFAWGDTPPFGEFAFAKFLEVAERAMARRGVVLGDGNRRALEAAWARRGAFAS